MQHAADRLPKLRQAVLAGDPGAGALLADLKVAMTAFPSHASAASTPSRDEAELSCAILQLAVIHYAKQADMRSFERTFAQLRPLFAAFSANTAAAAADRQLAIGLALMHLLVEARLAEFHCDVELLLHADADRSSPAVAFPLGLEAYLMEGSYNKILSAHHAMPAPELFAPFVERLARTVRDDIADCAAASFGALSLDAAQKLLMFDSQADLLAFARDKPSWNMQPGGIAFSVAHKSAAELPVSALIDNALSYATDLERIV